MSWREEGISKLHRSKEIRCKWLKNLQQRNTKVRASVQNYRDYARKGVFDGKEVRSEKDDEK